MEPWARRPADRGLPFHARDPVLVPHQQRLEGRPPHPGLRESVGEGSTRPIVSIRSIVTCLQPAYKRLGGKIPEIFISKKAKVRPVRHWRFESNMFSRFIFISGSQYVYCEIWVVPPDWTWQRASGSPHSALCGGPRRPKKAAAQPVGKNLTLTLPQIPRFMKNVGAQGTVVSHV